MRNPQSRENAPDNTFFRNVVTLVGGTAFSSSLIILAEPITSRFFPPESFGTAAAFYSGATILGIVGCLRYEMALVLPEKEEDARSLFILCAFILTVITGLSVIATLLFGKQAAVMLNLQGLLPSIWLFPVAVFLTGSDYLFRRWHSRYKRFNAIAWSRTLQAMPRVPAEVLGGMFGFTSAYNLIVFRIFGLLGPNVNLLRAFLRQDLRSVLKGYSFANILSNAGRYIKFPLFETFSTLLMILSFHAPTLLIAFFFGANEAGYFAKAFYLLFLPAFLVAESTSQVFLQYSAVSKNDGGKMSEIVETVLSRMFNLGIFPFALVVLIGPDLFKVVLGANWTEAGVYARVMVPWLFAVLLSNSIITLFAVLERQGMSLFYNAVLVLFRVAVLVLGGLIIKDIYITLIYFSLVSAVIISARCLHLVKMVNASIASLGIKFGKNIMLAIPSLLLVAYVKEWLHLSSLYVVCVGVFSAVLYLMLLIYYDHDVKSFICNKVKAC